MQIRPNKRMYNSWQLLQTKHHKLLNKDKYLNINIKHYVKIFYRHNNQYKFGADAVSLQGIIGVMNVQTFPSQLLERAVDELSKLPSIGRRTALRLALHLLRQSPEAVDQFADAISALRREVKFCRVCNNISDSDVCSICANPKRDASLICVVEHIQDVMLIENTQQYNGLYHVLGGVINPMGGIGPQNLNIGSLEERIAAGGIREVILALSTTMEGDTTNFYLLKLLKPSGITISTLARGVSFGDELERTDELTLGRALVNRVPL